MTPRNPNIPNENVTPTPPVNEEPTITREAVVALIETGISIVGTILALAPFAPPIQNDPFPNTINTAIGVCIYLIITAFYLVLKNTEAFRNFCLIACLVTFVATCFLGTKYYALYNSATLKSPDGKIRIVIGSVLEQGIIDKDANGRNIPLVDLVENDAAWKQPEKIWTSKSIHKSKEELTSAFILFSGFLETAVLSAIYLIVPRMSNTSTNKAPKRKKI